MDPATTCQMCGAMTARVTLADGTKICGLCQVAVARRASSTCDPMSIPANYWLADKNY